MTEKVVTSNRLDGSTTLREAIFSLGELGVELESLAGRGYTLNEPVRDGELLLVKPDPCAPNDREKLSASFMELEAVYNYAAPISLAWETDCVHHALLAIGERYDDERPGVAFWFSALDDEAFGYRGYSSYIKEEYEALSEDLEDRVAWVNENVAKIGAAEISERLQHNMLVRPLSIFWSGEPGPIVDVLKKNGLNVADEVNMGECIYVYPADYDSDI